MLALKRHLLPCLFLLAGPALLGCPSPNIYGTPRTTPKGELSHTVAIEGIAVSNPATGAVSPAPPTYQLRYGVADEVDLGFRLGNLTSLMIDAKWNFLKGDFDLAVDPGFQATYFAVSGASAFIGYGHLPLVAGINLGDSLALVPSVGGVVQFAAGSVSTSSDTSVNSDFAFFLRPGLGLHIRASDGFAIQPEATFMYDFDHELLAVMFGVGFSFGELPDRPGGK
jgi:hypothetical protein